MEDILLERTLVEEKLDISVPKERKKFDTKKEPKKSFTNFQRNQFRSLFSSMALSDRKSMILVRINITLISGLIVFHHYIEQNVPLGSILEITAIIGIGISLVASLLSSKPSGVKDVLKQQINPNYSDLKDNMLMHFSNPTLEEYEDAMDKVVRSQHLQIGNQVRTSYLINFMLLRQFKWLKFAYNSLITTFVVVIFIFLIGLMLG